MYEGTPHVTVSEDERTASGARHELTTLFQGNRTEEDFGISWSDVWMGFEVPVAVEAARVLGHPACVVMHVSDGRRR